MKKNTFLFIVIFALACSIKAQNDTMYIMKSGNIIDKFNVNTEIDSIIFYKPNASSGNTFIDDRDGNEYHYITIANQTWMAENLKYLPSVNQVSDGSITEAKYYVYGYNGTDVNEAKQEANYQIYGVLYNWSAGQNACPNGWHLPSNAEWLELNNFLATDVGGKLKEIGTTHWNAPNVGATNEVGFTALPGGSRNEDNEFYDIGDYGYWWTASQSTETLAWYYYMSHAYSNANNIYYTKELGYSVRCIKD